MKRTGLAPVVVGLLAGILALAGGGCGGNGGETLVLGATTSVADPGLLDELVSAFEKESSYHVTPVVGSSGQIIEQARRGELDVIMTHSPADEKKFVDDGEGLEPKKVMENYFVVAGPPRDPAGVGKASTLAEAFRAISEAKAPFISRGDNSGTHKRELATWESVGIDPRGQGWYQESSVSQGQNVLVASDKSAYTLVDTSTFVSVRDRVDLKALVVDRDRPNVYTVMLVNPAKHGRVNAVAARAWAAFVTGPSGQAVIADFGREKYGETLFVPLGNAVTHTSP